VFDDRTAAENEHASRVRQMFATIATRYDLLNHLLSGNIDKRWRRVTASWLRDNLPPGEVRILDVACGTGDLSLTLFQTTGARVVGADFCRPMLEIASKKAFLLKGAIPFVEADALNLPFLNCSFEGATIAFGLRNLASIERGLRELLRVLKPGGQVAVLEFSQPVLPGFRAVFHFYFTKLLPFVGGLLSGSRAAYEYLPSSVSRFPGQKELVSLMRRVGFEEVEYRNLTGGIAALHLGKRP
jgi:demethylmenaquinone methyltransferase / 2-methoxy-6-polyprenyl-1,4-benzoquinol methylase